MTKLCINAIFQIFVSLIHTHVVQNIWKWYILWIPIHNIEETSLPESSKKSMPN